jgi:hypothetical protein
MPLWRPSITSVITDKGSESSPVVPTHASVVSDKLVTLCQVLVGIGFLMAVFGVAIGLRMALKATLIECPDGTFHAQGADERCFAHFHAGQGTAIALLSGMLLILFVLAALIFGAMGRAAGDAQSAGSGAQSAIG